jgi:hypothetical protein
MAKSYSDSINDDLIEKQEPEKPKKNQKGLTLPVIIGIFSGVIIINAIIIIVVLKLLLVPASPTSADQLSDKQKTENADKMLKSSDEMDDGVLSDEEREKLVSWEIKNIPATPRGMEKSAFFTVKFVCIPNEKKLFEKLSKKFDDDVTGKVLIAETEFKINDVFSKYSKEQIDNINRDTLNIMIYKQLKSTFDKENIKLRKILVTWAFY